MLDYMPMPHLPIVEIKGVGLKRVPLPGQVFDQQDLAAGVALAVLLNRMDAEVMPKNPLLEHIASIDVRNFNGRKNRREPHIVLRSKDDTQIIWGAEIGEWTKYAGGHGRAEARQALRLLPGLRLAQRRGKYINLRDPQDKIPQPIDKYRN